MSGLFSRWGIKLSDQNGATLLYMAVFLVFVATMGVSVISLSAADQEGTGNAVDTAKAEYESLAGLEWAMFQLNNGEDPRTTAELTLHAEGSTLSFRTFDEAGQLVEVSNPKGFGDGSFTVTYDSETRQVTSVGTFGAATARHAMTAPPSCLELLSGAVFNFPSDAASGTMSNVGFRKLDTTMEDTDGDGIEDAEIDCLNQVFITDVRVSWTGYQNGELVTGIMIDGTIHYDAVDGPGTPAGGAASNTLIGIDSDFAVNDTEDHAFDAILFSYPAGSPLSSPQTFIVEVTLADGSTVSKSYVYNVTSGGIVTNDPVVIVGATPLVDVTPDTDGGDSTNPFGDVAINDTLAICPDCINNQATTTTTKTTSVTAYVDFDYTLKDNTTFEDYVSPVRTNKSDSDGKYPCEECEGSIKVKFLSSDGATIHGGLCNAVDAKPHDGYSSSFEQECEYSFDAASLNEINKVELDAYDGISLRIDSLYVHLHLYETTTTTTKSENGIVLSTDTATEEIDDQAESLAMPDDRACLYDTETSIDPGASHLETYDTGADDYSFSIDDHECDAENYGYDRMLKRTL